MTEITPGESPALVVLDFPTRQAAEQYAASYAQDHPGRRSALVSDGLVVSTEPPEPRVESVRLDGGWRALFAGGGTVQFVRTT